MKITRLSAAAAVVSLAFSIPALAAGQEREKKDEKPSAASSGKTKVIAQPTKGESPLVEAARDAAAARKEAKTRTVIDNHTVRQTTGTITVLAERPEPVQIKSDEEVSNERLERSREQGRYAEARAAAQRRLERAQEEVSSLETELRRLEEDYYEEDDIEHRDGVLERRYVKAQRQLEKVRAEVIDAREALGSLREPRY
jgi:peptidyl-tRNA hydrolase